MPDRRLSQIRRPLRPIARTIQLNTKHERTRNFIRNNSRFGLPNRAFLKPRGDIPNAGVIKGELECTAFIRSVFSYNTLSREQRLHSNVQAQARPEEYSIRRSYVVGRNHFQEKKRCSRWQNHRYVEETIGEGGKANPQLRTVCT